MKEQFNKQGYYTIKILLVECFLGEIYKLRGFLTQIKIKITNKGPELLMAIKKSGLCRIILNRKGIGMV